MKSTIYGTGCKISGPELALYLSKFGSVRVRMTLGIHPIEKILELTNPFSKGVCRMDGLTDLEIVSHVRNGDRKAYAFLVRRHQKSLLRLSMRFVKDLDAAEDVVQESFIKAYERLASFEARSSFRSWLFQIAINTAKNKLRNKRDTTLDIENVPLGVAAQAESSLVHNAISGILQECVESLPFKQRTALTLRIYEDLSFKEIAEIMECPYDTAKANYRHALMNLREKLESHQDLRAWTEEVGGFFMEFEQRGMAEAE